MTDLFDFRVGVKWRKALIGFRFLQVSQDLVPSFERKVPSHCYTSLTPAKMKDNLIITLFAVIFMAAVTCATNRRCFDCRSRGDLGDCRDPFYFSPNSTAESLKHMTGVESPPCASGWCIKVEEGGEHIYKDAEYGVATERECMAFPPSDGKERCTEVTRRGKRVYVCFCKGDLCNDAGNIKMSQWMLVSTLVMMVLNRRT